MIAAGGAQMETSPGRRRSPSAAAAGEEPGREPLRIGSGEGETEDSLGKEKEGSLFSRMI
jgi:hypothetical protein